MIIFLFHLILIVSICTVETQGPASLRTYAIIRMQLMEFWNHHPFHHQLGVTVETQCIASLRADAIIRMQSYGCN